MVIAAAAAGHQMGRRREARDCHAHCHMARGCPIGTHLRESLVEYVESVPSEAT